MKSRLRVPVLSFVIVGCSLLGSAYYQSQLRQEQQHELQMQKEAIAARINVLERAYALELDGTLRLAQRNLQLLQASYGAGAAPFERAVQQVLASDGAQRWQGARVFDAAGRTLFATGSALALQPTDLLVGAPGQSGALALGKVLPVAGSGELIPLSLRGSDAQGRPLTLTLLLRTDYLADVFNALDASHLDRLSLVRPDASILWRSRDLQTALVTHVPRQRPYLLGLPGASGSFADYSTIEQIALLFDWQRLAQWPLAVVVGVDEAAEIAQTRALQSGEQLHAAIVMAALIVFSFGVAALLLRLGRKNAQLHESEERFRLFFEKNGSVMLVIEPRSGRVLEANAAAHRYYGYPGKDLVGLSIEAINTLTPAEIAQERLLAEQEQRNYFRFVHRLASGELRDVEVQSTPVSLGGQVRLYSIINDITARCWAEKQLVEVMEVQKAILQSQVVGIAMLRNRRITWVNPAYARMLGYRSEQLIDRSTRMLHVDDAAYASFESLAYPQINAGQVFRQQMQYVRADGSPGWFDVSGARLNADSEDSVWAVVDMTASHVLAQERRRLAQAVEQSPVAIVVTNLRGEIDYVNEAFCMNAGYARYEVLGRNTRMLRSEHADVQQFEAMWKTLQAGQVWRGIFCNARKDGSIYWESAQISPVADEFGTVVQYLAVKEDITERREAEKRLLEARSHLQASHDLLAQLSRYVPGVIFQYQLYADGRARFPYASAGLRDVFGLVPKQVQDDASAVLAVLHPDDRQRFTRSLQESAQNRQLWWQEFRVTRPGTGVRWVAGHAMPAAQIDGSVIWHGIISDVTEKKDTESRLQLAAQVFSHAREGIIIADADGDIVDVNATFTHITGYARDEVLGRSPRLLASGRHPPEFFAMLWRSLLADDYWSGEIWNRRKDNELYIQTLTISVVRDSAGRVENYVALFNDITQMKEHQRQLEKIAHFDALTGLPNRLLLADRLQQAIVHCQRQSNSLAVVYLDLDGFKAVNDAHGHDVGDELLVAIGQRLKHALREGDTLARMGGDEFVAVLTQLDQPQDCAPVIERLLQCAAEPVVAAGFVLTVSASIGVTYYPQDGVDADLLLRHADQAMYLAKHAGKNRYHVFDVVQDAAVKIHHESLERIRKALAEQEFVLHYQPKVDMRTGAVVGAEALIRWQHPQRGLLPPGAFLPVVENDPVSVALGAWVLEEALRQMSAWRAQGFLMAVSVNVGARQLQSAEFVSTLDGLLQRYSDVPPSFLELEVLETSALEDVVQVSKIMQACNVLGVSFALDDFGTGYSSLIYLKRLPAGLLKIDQSFVRDMLEDVSDCAIVEAVIGLAAVFKRNVIAEGVETIAHGTLLRQMGCPLVQGYGIARPMPAAALPDWVAQWQSPPEWQSTPRPPVLPGLSTSP